MVGARQLDQGKIVQLQEQNALLIQRLFGRKSEQTIDPDSPQLEIFNEAESLAEGKRLKLLTMRSRKKSLRRPSVVASASRCRRSCRASKSSTSCPSMS